MCQKKLLSHRMKLTVRWVSRWKPAMMRGILRPVVPRVPFCQDFFPALFLRHVADTGFGEAGFKEDHQVMEQAEEYGLGGFGRDTASP